MTFLDFVTFNYGYLFLAAVGLLLVTSITLALVVTRQARDIRDLKRTVKPLWFDWLDRNKGQQ